MSTPQRRFWSGMVYFLAGFGIMVVLGWWVFPRVLYSQKAQPFNFAHAKHGEKLDLTCESCHAFRPDGSFQGIPNMESCGECHNPDALQGKDPQEAIFVEAYLKKGKQVPWLIYSKQPPCVYFSHAPHVKLAAIECKTCHGPNKDQEQILPLYKENRLSGYSINIWGRRISGWKTNSWDRMKMDDCADCHARHGASNACFTCHK
jgi:hypothetical protein